MSEFKPIETQDEFDKRIQERIQREREKYKDYDALKEKAVQYDELAGKDYEKTIAALRGDLDAERGKIAEITARAEKAETSLLKSQIAQEFHIPLELAERLSGADEKSIRADAEAFAQFVTTQKQGAPLRSTEPPKIDPLTAGFSQLLSDLKGE